MGLKGRPLHLALSSCTKTLDPGRALGHSQGPLPRSPHPMQLLLSAPSQGFPDGRGACRSESQPQPGVQLSREASHSIRGNCVPTGACHQVALRAALTTRPNTGLSAV